MSNDYFERMDTRYPDVRFALEKLIAKGCKLISVNDGEETIKVNSVRKALDVIFSVDESTCRIETPDGDRPALSFMLGNSPGEALYDYTVNDIVDDVCDEIGKIWL